MISIDLKDRVDSLDADTGATFLDTFLEESKSDVKLCPEYILEIVVVAELHPFDRSFENLIKIKLDFKPHFKVANKFLPHDEFFLDTSSPRMNHHEVALLSNEVNSVGWEVPIVVSQLSFNDVSEDLFMAHVSNSHFSPEGVF